MNIQDIKGKTVAFAGSGGLDSCTIVRWLTDNDVNVVCMTADFGQPDINDKEEIRQRMLACGTSKFIFLDLRKQLALEGIEVIKTLAFHEGRYWNTTGIARHVLVKGILEEMSKHSLNVLAHGCTGRGNDQVRFQLISNLLNPNIEVYAPWRDYKFLSKFGGRKEMIEFCREEGLPIKASEHVIYSTDANLLGLTHEAGELESLSTPANFVKPVMGLHPRCAPNEPEIVSITFEEGNPVAINSEQVDSLQAIEQANIIAGRHGVGLNLHLVENRLVGIKSRGVYEAPGMELLGQAYEYLLQLILDASSLEVFTFLSRFLSKQIYSGKWYDVSSEMARLGITPITRLATGKVTVELYKGKISYVASNAKYSLYNSENASMDSVGEFDHANAEGFLRVMGMNLKALNTSGQFGVVTQK